MTLSSSSSLSFLDVLLKAYYALQEEQQDILLEASYSAQDRMALASELGHLFYTRGFPPLSPEEVAEEVAEGVLVALLYLLVCGERDLERLSVVYAKWVQSGEKRQQRKREKTSDDTDDLSQVPPGDGEAPPHRGSRRTRRSAGRVGERYTRPVPGPHMPS